jgi:hypothetical protein
VALALLDSTEREQCQRQRASAADIVALERQRGAKFVRGRFEPIFCDRLPASFDMLPDPLLP